MAYFYFSRCRPARDDADRYLVSGVVEARDLSAARLRLGFALRESASGTTADEFRFTELDSLPRLRENCGLLCVTTVDRD